MHCISVWHKPGAFCLFVCTRFKHLNDEKKEKKMKTIQREQKHTKMKSQKLCSAFQIEWIRRDNIVNFCCSSILHICFAQRCNYINVVWFKTYDTNERAHTLIFHHFSSYRSVMTRNENRVAPVNRFEHNIRLRIDCNILNWNND